MIDTLRSVFDRTPWFVSEHDHVVEMECPNHDHVVATESTVPEWTDDKLAAYLCDRCNREHLFRWGSLTPEYVGDASGYPG